MVSLCDHVNKLIQYNLLQLMMNAVANGFSLCLVGTGGIRM